MDNSRTQTILDVLHQSILETIQLAGTRYKWNPGAGRYYDSKTGRFVSESVVRTVAESYVRDNLEPGLVKTTQRLIDGKLSLADWQVTIANQLKTGYTVTLTIAKGGRNNITPADWGRMGGRLRFEYRKLNAFAQEIKLGLLSEKQILARIRLYARGAITSYFDGETQAKIEAGYTMERRHTTPAEHCDDCLMYESMGWQPVGTLPPPGVNSACLHNCHCYKEYRK